MRDRSGREGGRDRRGERKWPGGAEVFFVALFVMFALSTFFRALQEARGGARAGGGMTGSVLLVVLCFALSTLLAFCGGCVEGGDGGRGAEGGGMERF